MTGPDILIACQKEGWGFIPILARRYGLGVEVGDFADPDLLEDDWRGRLEELRPLLQQIPGERALHGPRSDLNPGLRDRKLVAFCRERYRKALAVAVEVGAGAVIFHTGYNPLIRAPGFERRWLRRSADFWREMAEEAGRLGLQILLENVWEPHPAVLRDLLEATHSPIVRACFDAGHANIYSRQSPEEWLATLGEYTVYLHLHNNDGRVDTHGPLEEGTVDFTRFLPLLALHPHPPRLVLEVSGDREAVEDSLFFLRRALGL